MYASIGRCPILPFDRLKCRRFAGCFRHRFLSVGVSFLFDTVRFGLCGRHLRGAVAVGFLYARALRYPGAYDLLKLRQHLPSRGDFTHLECQQLHAQAELIKPCLRCVHCLLAEAVETRSQHIIHPHVRDDPGGSLIENLFQRRRLVFGIQHVSNGIRYLVAHRELCPNNVRVACQCIAVLHGMQTWRVVGK